MPNIFHALIITGGTGETRYQEALRLAAGSLCGSGDGPPCMICPSCKKAALGGHPDIHTLQPEKSAVIEVRRVRALREELLKAPHEGICKIAIIHSDSLNTQGQNALLAVLEEPPGGTLFFLLSEAPMFLLPTVRSRCHVKRLPEPPEGEIRDESANLMGALLSGDEWSWLSACYSLEKKSRPDISDILDGFARLLIDGLIVQDVLTTGRFGSIIDKIRIYQDMLIHNVGAGHVCGALAAEGMKYR